MGTFAALGGPYCVAVMCALWFQHLMGPLDLLSVRYLCVSLQRRNLAATKHNANLDKRWENKIGKWIHETCPENVWKMSIERGWCWAIRNLPLKWKKWLFARVVFSCSSIIRSMSGWMLVAFWTLNPNRHVGHEVSCSSHDCKHELFEKKENEAKTVKFSKCFVKNELIGQSANLLMKQMWTR